ncbi:3-deoxy-D-manno-octulosonic acid transferase [Thiomicrorhabdus sp. ZW0627]|uniref:3-deoxy-D-manno-octulosonic acid transferase n=1 Tax=Thiomicrorhabdus sp. ZW0627 TaxID=3039774 RepID=UPI002436BDE0|nr:3-deoxy-D-manno-octulosonic acid transferase [Thiomicrorhabdus sp. ZW0627]MDG6774303.1 3-deoxy-D-manno-octulosonic acid transferase [Thiomicrorhabdus sp. ZW0627]
MYQLLIRLLSPLIWVLILVDAFKRKGGWPFVVQRLGLYYPPLKTLQPNQKPIWFHCASVGEVKAAEPLIRALIAHYPLLITTSTPTGKDLVVSSFGDQVVHRYLPLDWPFAIRHFLKRHQPARLWVMETEIWPNLYRIVSANEIELCILNGRLSKKTLRAPAWLQKTYRQSLLQVDMIIARSQDEAKRFEALGAKPGTIQVLNNLKYAALPEVHSQVRPIERPYVLAASTHEDEELQISRIWLSLNRPELLVIVPRHPQRSGQIQKQLIALDAGLKVASKNETPEETTKLFLDDRIGKLMALFAHAEMVIMGGSFVPKGGHNILEPAAFAKPIITGPDMSDFEDELALLKEHQGIVQTQDYNELKATLQTLMNDPEKAQNLGMGAKQALDLQQDTLQKYLETLDISLNKQ